MCFFGLVETVKDMRNIFFWNTRTVIANADINFMFADDRFYCEQTVIFRHELNCIINQIVKNLPDSVPVRFNKHRFVIKLSINIGMFRRDTCFKGYQHAAYQIVYVENRQIKLVLTGFNSGNIKQIIDHSGHPTGLVKNDFDIFFMFVRRNRAILHCFEKAAN